MTNTTLTYNQIYNMDCLDGLRLLESDSIQMAVTSPPYWALRSYGCAGQIGQEDTPQEYIDRLCAVFAELHRVLKPDGVFFLNIGDTYCGTGNKADYYDPKYPKGRTGQKKAKNNRIPGIKAKDLCGIPWAVAFALRDMGWYLRQDCIWSKPNPLPESVTDRCVKSHEYLFLFAKSQRYYFDHKAIREPAVDARKNGIHKGSAKYNRPMTESGSVQSLNRGNRQRCQWEDGQPLRNKRSVWTVATKGISDGHFAAYPPALIEPCILAGCPPGEVVLDPFMGAGTTAVVAKALGRQYIGFELNPEYITIAEKRIKEGK
jgi:DNA modification methylase